MILSKTDQDLIHEAYKQMNAADNTSKYSLTVGGETYNIGDVIPECPFEGTSNASLIDINRVSNPNAEATYDVSVYSDGEGYTISTKDYPNITINKIDNSK